MYNIQEGKTRENHWLTLKPGSIGSTVVVAAQYNRTHWWERSRDTPQCDRVMWNECGKMDPKEDLSPMKIAIWLTDTIDLKNTSRKKTPCKTRQQSQAVKQRSFCYLLSCTNTALIFLRQLRAFERFTFVFSVALQNFRLQVCTDRISVPPPAGKTSTEWCVKRSFQPLTTTLPVTHILILCWSHVVLIEKLVGAAITKVGQMTNSVFQLKNPGYLAERRNMIFLSWCGRLFYPYIKHHLSSGVRRKKIPKSKSSNDFPNSRWKSLAELKNPGWACTRSVTVWQGTEQTCWISHLNLLNFHLFKHYKKSSMVGSTAILLVTRKNPRIIARPDICFFVFLQQLVLILCKWHWQLPKNN